MARLPADNPHRKELFGLMHTIEKQLNMDRNNVMLVLMELNTEEKIQSFFRWIKARLDGEQIAATPREIVRAACDISDRRDKTVRILELTNLCLEKPLSLEKIQYYITQNDMDSEEVTRAAIELCEKGEFDCVDFFEKNKRMPNPDELITFRWEELFDLFLANGLDANLVICDDGINYENILQSLRYIDDGNLHARLVRKILSNHGSPNVLIGGVPLFRDVDFDLVYDLKMGLFDNNYEWQLDQAIAYWLVLFGFGGVINDDKLPVRMCDGLEPSMFKEFEKFTYKLIKTSCDFELRILNKETKKVVAIL